MRLQLSWIAVMAAAGVAATAGPARGDGELGLRTQYYKERSTRVAQPMIDARIDLGDDSELRGHALVDAITSASPGSGAAGQPFTEYRWEAGAGYTHGFGGWRAGGDFRFSRESDYQSVTGVLRGELDLASRNTTLGLAVGGGHDTLSNAGAQGGISQPIEGSLDTALASASISQVLSRTMIAGAGYDLIYLDGFLANPYRTVAAGGVLEMERLPATRLRHALSASVRAVLPATSTTGVASYRLYFDDWGMVAHSPEVRVIQEWKNGLAVHLRGRYHRQSRADFYRAVYDSSDPALFPYLTDDVKLSHFDAYTAGVKVEAPLALFGVCGPHADVRVDLLAEYVVQHNRFGNAFVGGLGVTVPVEP